MTGMVSESRTLARPGLGLAAKVEPLTSQPCGVTPGTSKDTATTGSMCHLFPVRRNSQGADRIMHWRRLTKFFAYKRRGLYSSLKNSSLYRFSIYIPTEDDSSLVRTSVSVGITQAAPVNQTSRWQMVSLLPSGAGPQQVLCLGTACTISAMSSAPRSSQVGTSPRLLLPLGARSQLGFGLRSCSDLMHQEEE